MKTVKLRFKDHCIKWLAILIIQGLWRTCKVKIHNQDKIQNILTDKTSIIPCYWHQQHLFGLWYLVYLHKHFNKQIGVLASPSRDGEIPSRIIQRWGIHIIRGSSSKTGAQALRDLCKSVDDGISPSITPDGPKGPIFEAKPGAIMLAQHTGSPIVPIKIQADHCWYLKSWDKFMIPKPFSKINIIINDPINIDKKLPLSALAEQQQLLTSAINQD